MAALMLVAVMALVVGMLMVMDGGLMPVLVAVVGMGLGPVGVFVLMFVFAVAAHTVSLPFIIFSRYYNSAAADVNSSSAEIKMGPNRLK